MKGSHIRISFGDVRQKSIVTPNHFISHMIEHIAWRMGLSMDLVWQDFDWKALGSEFASEIIKFPVVSEKGAAFGMIDDGSSIVSVALGSGSVTLNAAGGVDLDWFLEQRCEQLQHGRELLQLLEGIASGLSAQIDITVWSLKDPHHTWEGIFRGVGITLGRMFGRPEPMDKLNAQIDADTAVEKFDDEGEIVVLERGISRARVRRGTAETGITLAVDFSSRSGNTYSFDVDSSIANAIESLPQLLDLFSESFGVGLDVQFKATLLSSSHVVMEDVGLVLGRALLEVLKLRMEKYGINAAGSNIKMPEDASADVQVGVSIEGRKFWQFVAEDGNAERLQRKFLIRHNSLGGLRSEDLDDLIDGLAGGMCASIAIHMQRFYSPDTAWQSVFKSLGLALREAFSANPYRKGVPPGVKATLA